MVLKKGHTFWFVLVNCPTYQPTCFAGQLARSVLHLSLLEKRRLLIRVENKADLKFIFDRCGHFNLSRMFVDKTLFTYFYTFFSQTLTGVLRCSLDVL